MREDPVARARADLAEADARVARKLRRDNARLNQMAARIRLHPLRCRRCKRTVPGGEPAARHAATCTR